MLGKLLRVAGIGLAGIFGMAAFETDMVEPVRDKVVEGQLRLAGGFHRMVVRLFNTANRRFGIAMIWSTEAYTDLPI